MLKLPKIDAGTKQVIKVVTIRIVAPLVAVVAVDLIARKLIKDDSDN